MLKPNLRVCVVGAGFVGLNLCAALSNTDFSVYIVDTDAKKIDRLRTRNLDILSAVELHFAKSANFDNVLFFDSSELGKSQVIEQFDVVVFCTPTYIEPDGSANCSSLLSAWIFLRDFVSCETLLIIESTTLPGFIRDVFAPKIADHFGLNLIECNIAHAPERIDPGNETWPIEKVPRLVSGMNQKSLELTVEFYSKLGMDLQPVSKLEISEAAKVFENAFRLVNISLVNELSIAFRRAGLSPSEVFDAAYSKPFGIMSFKFGAGAGGYCIPVSSGFLKNWARNYLDDLTIVTAAQEIDSRMRDYSISRIDDFFSGELENKVIIFSGVGYKAGSDDTRFSPANEIWNAMANRGCILFWADTWVKSWGERKSWSSIECRNVDLIVSVNGTMPEELSNLRAPILDFTK
jgi:UDP-N-acetyl-D-glucosamine dehydrogenase